MHMMTRAGAGANIFEDFILVRGEGVHPPTMQRHNFSGGSRIGAGDPTSAVPGVQPSEGQNEAHGLHKLLPTASTLTGATPLAIHKYFQALSSTNRAVAPSPASNSASCKSCSVFPPDFIQFINTIIAHLPVFPSTPGGKSLLS